MLAELGEAARQRFIRANLRLVSMVAGRWPSAATCHRPISIRRAASG